MANRIEINFTPCDPPPNGGYNVYYRVELTTGPYIFAGNFTTPPITIADTTYPNDTKFEGYIVAVCDGLEGDPVYWGMEDLVQGTLDIQTDPNRWVFSFNKPFPCDTTLGSGGVGVLNYISITSMLNVTSADIPAGVMYLESECSAPGDEDWMQCAVPQTPGSDIMWFAIDCAGTPWRIRLVIIAAICP
jgi:hypothetical protein